MKSVKEIVGNLNLDHASERTEDHPFLNAAAKSQAVAEDAAEIKGLAKVVAHSGAVVGADLELRTATNIQAQAESVGRNSAGKTVLMEAGLNHMRNKLAESGVHIGTPDAPNYHIQGAGIMLMQAAKERESMPKMKFWDLKPGETRTIRLLDAARDTHPDHFMLQAPDKGLPKVNLEDPEAVTEFVQGLRQNVHPECPACAREYQKDLRYGASRFVDDYAAGPTLIQTGFRRPGMKTVVAVLQLAQQPKRHRRGTAQTEAYRKRVAKKWAKRGLVEHVPERDDKGWVKIGHLSVPAMVYDKALAFVGAKDV